MDSFGTRLKLLRKKNRFTQKTLAKKLGLAQTTIANYEGSIRFPNQDILNSIAKLFNVSLDFLLGNDKKNFPLPFLKQSSFRIDLPHLQKIYLEELLKGNKQGVYEGLVYALQMGISLKDLYSNVIAPSLVEIGKGWEENRISVSDEHFFSLATENILAQLATQITPLHKKKNRVALLCTHGEGHSIALKMISHLLEEDGWETFYLGTNVPTDSLINFLDEKSIDLVAISVTMDQHINGMQSLIKTIRTNYINKPLKILVGGRGISHDPLLWKSLGADDFASSIEDVVEVANRMGFYRGIS
ncbi:cobalamin-dependent protein [Alkaliphilus hydrothermalis]|uniref:Methanogenic corrinoid protein MtbC1 n=1 Tax=Alkaliphilus hydrothermalis TaxID=1482730 RepID=A0ABS2NTY2_9FIRM|nr:cobalamin-dependent protein [Alkaliphilus hydrothermalis]MBM7616425.1 methanogenic corrinoid protein MtbC1 [Alkaliphilus hydrothermalis]